MSLVLVVWVVCRLCLFAFVDVCCDLCLLLYYDGFNSVVVCYDVSRLAFVVWCA